ncbi:MAG: hypothetical protein H6835_00575 [Planctomycetes bacterium]|nr:hypothetical protein [Planctomycetota bacterium]
MTELRRLALSLLAATAAAQEPATPAPAEPAPLVWDDAARLHTAATTIARGTLHVDRDALLQVIADGGHVPVTVDIAEVLHGEPAKQITFYCYVPKGGAAKKAWEWAAATVRALDDQDRVVFVASTEGNLYLTGNPDSGTIAEPTREQIVAIRRREMQHRAWLAQPLPQDKKRQREVVRLVKRLTGGAELQRESFAALEALGEDAVVELIAAMDDRRKLPEAKLTLDNHAADAFEAQRRYAPKLVVDGMAAILNQITHESFGGIFNGASDAERDAAVRGWTLYAHYVLAARQRAAEQQRADKARDG